jgi:hypothetical protein
LAGQAVCLLGVSHSVGLHAENVPIDDLILVTKLIIIGEILYVMNLGWTKLGFLLMFYRIFHFDYFKKRVYLIGAFVIAWVICDSLMHIFLCVPVQKNWYPETPGHCINVVGTWAANAASTIFSDLVILLLPIPEILRLSLAKSEKIGLILTFSLGFL